MIMRVFDAFRDAKVAERIAYGIHIYRHSIVALYAVQVLEWAELLSEEITLIHNAPWSSMKVLYLICRYYPFLGWPFYMWTILGNHDVKTCTRIVHAIYALLIPLPVSSQSVILIRTYAFTGGKRIILIILSFMFLSLLGFSIWTFTYDIHEAVSVFRPYVGDTECIRLQSRDKSVVAARTGIFLFCACGFDIICLIMIGIHCLKMHSVQGRLGQLFLKQGVAACFVMSATNLVAGIECFKPIHGVHGIGLQFAFVVNNLVVCRLILHIRRFVRPSASEVDANNSRMIRSVLGRLDEAIQLDEWANN